jgi:nicotinamide mononucleotide transporter
MGVYGWIHWAGADRLDKKTQVPVLRLNIKEAMGLLAITLVLFVGIALFLIYFTDSTIPWIDAFTTSLSFTATWMLARKILEHWLIWVVVNTVSIALYFYRGLYPTIILFVVLTILAVIGYIEWKKEWEKRKTMPILS